MPEAHNQLNAATVENYTSVQTTTTCVAMRIKWEKDRGGLAQAF
jgi:hypothetical protein